MELFWMILLFIGSLVALVKGADWLIDSAEKIGLAVGLSPFIIGAVIIGLGTSLPELLSAIMAVLKGVNEIVVANSIGSNIANILLVAGLAVVVGKGLRVTKNLIDIDLPLLAITTSLFLGVAWDRKIEIRESILLLIVFVIYFFYTLYHQEGKESKKEDKTLLEEEKSGKISKKDRPKVFVKDVVYLFVGIISLILGAKFLIDSVVEISVILSIGAGAVSLFAVALGTSLPELMVSVKAALKKKPEVALGNVFGSNIFNLLFVVGIPGMFTVLKLDEVTFTLGLPVLAIVTFLFVISGISRRIHIYEGATYLVIYIFFIGKLFGFL